MITLNLTQDWQVWDGLEGAVLRSAKTAGDWIETPVTAKRRSVNYKEVTASNGVYTEQDRVWLVPNALVDTGPIKSRDQIRDDSGVAWTVLEADLRTLATVWRLVTRNLIIANDLADTITIETPTITLDAAGGSQKAWAVKTVGSTVYQNLPCRVQPITTEIVEERGFRGLKGNYIVPVAMDLVLTNDDRVKVISTPVPLASPYLEIRGYHSPQSIEDLFVIDAELMP